ncbi:MAG: MFS transporter [Conexivisphaerales archaeon]
MTAEMPFQEVASRPARGFLSGIPQRVLLLIVVMAVNNFGFSYLSIVLSAYLPQLGVSVLTVGFILGADGLSMAVLTIPLGILSDRRGRKWILILGSMGAAPVFFIVALTLNPFLLVLAAAIAGVTQGAYMSTVNALIADQTTAQNRNSAFAASFVIAGTGGSLGAALPFFIPSLASVLSVGVRSTHMGLLLFFGTVSLFTPLALFLILRNYHETARPAGKLWKGKSTANLLKFSSINSLIGLGAGFIIPLIPTWLLLRFSIPDTYSGPILAFSSLTIGLAAVFSPRLARRFGQVNAIAMTQGLSLVFMVSVAYAGNPTLACSLYIVRAILMNMASPLSDSFLMGIVAPEERGFASSVNAVVWNVPNSVTTIFGAAILRSGDYVLPFLLAGSLYAIAIPLFYAVFRKTTLTS